MIHSWYPVVPEVTSLVQKVSTNLKIKNKKTVTTKAMNLLGDWVEPTPKMLCRLC
jgi:hypothetical protein